MPEKHPTLMNRKCSALKLSYSEQLLYEEFKSSLSSWWILFTIYNWQQVYTTPGRISLPSSPFLESVRLHINGSNNLISNPLEVESAFL